MTIFKTPAALRINTAAMAFGAVRNLPSQMRVPASSTTQIAVSFTATSSLIIRLSSVFLVKGRQAIEKPRFFQLRHVIHDPTFPAQQDVDPKIALARLRCRQITDTPHQRCLVRLVRDVRTDARSTPSAEQLRRLLTVEAPGRTRRVRVVVQASGLLWQNVPGVSISAWRGPTTSVGARIFVVPPHRARPIPYAERLLLNTTGALDLNARAVDRGALCREADVEKRSE